MTNQLFGLGLLAVILEILGTALMLWAVYFTLKRAIKDGIRESGLVEAIRRHEVDTTLRRDPKL